MSEMQEAFINLRRYMNTSIVGQGDLIDKMLVCLLGDGHLLVEGAPGLAKTKAIRKLAQAIECDAHRIQFTPDLLPADITGSDVYRPENGTFVFQKGPIFHNFILADEINRAPAKVQSALLEAMAERQVTVGATTYLLPELFLVMATQNPIENEGTYPLPEAQLDRFLMFVRIGHPDAASEHKILQIVRNEARQQLENTQLQKITQKQVKQARAEVQYVHLSSELEEYIVQFIMATRNPAAYGPAMASYVEYGASPRGTIALDVCSRAYAWLNGRDYVMPNDIHAVLHDVLRHRVLLTYEAEAKGITPDSFIDMLMQKVPLP